MNNILVMGLSGLSFRDRLEFIVEVKPLQLQDSAFVLFIFVSETTNPGKKNNNFIFSNYFILFSVTVDTKHIPSTVHWARGGNTPCKGHQSIASQHAHTYSHTLSHIAAIQHSQYTGQNVWECGRKAKNPSEIKEGRTCDTPQNNQKSDSNSRPWSCLNSLAKYINFLSLQSYNHSCTMTICLIANVKTSNIKQHKNKSQSLFRPHCLYAIGGCSSITAHSKTVVLARQHSNQHSNQHSDQHSDHEGRPVTHTKNKRTHSSMYKLCCPSPPPPPKTLHV